MRHCISCTCAKVGAGDTARKQAKDKPKSDKLSWKEQRELAALPERIAALEAEQQDLAQRLSDPALYGDSQQAQAVATRLAAIDEELLTLLERWENLETRLK